MANDIPPIGRPAATGGRATSDRLVARRWPALVAYTALDGDRPQPSPANEAAALAKTDMRAT